MLIYAHRGSSGREPENTLRAFAAAIADGADGVELDLHATADGIPVVIHDRNIARTTNGQGYVDTLTLADLRAFDAGLDERVPTFAEVLDLLAGRVYLDIEIKQAEIHDAVLTELANHPTAHVAISSFDWNILRAVRQSSPDVELWPLTMTASSEALATAAELNSPAIALFAGAVTADVALTLDAADLDLMVWTVNDVAQARLARTLGAAAICTDVPAAIIAGLKG